LATCGVADPGGSGWPLLVVDVVDPPPVDVLDVVLRALVVVAMPLRVVVVPCAVAEISMVVYLLVVGVRTVKPGSHVLAAA